MKICLHQSGFMPSDSTVNQLVYLYNCFAKALDEKKDVHVVLCNIAKALDKVWHKGLLFKLQKIGITGAMLTWIESYLSERKERVTIHG